MFIESVMPSNYLVLCHPLLLLPSVFSSIRFFSSELAFHIMQPKYWRFNFSISPSNKYSRLTSFRIDWFSLLAVQGTLESLLQHHSSKTSVLECSAFFMVQLSYWYMTPGETIPFTIWTSIGKVKSLLFNTLFQFVIAFLPRRKQLLISWPRSPSAMILEPKKIKSVTVSIFSPSVCHEKEMATYSSILAWKIPWTEYPGRLQSMVLQGVGHDLATQLHFFICHEVIRPGAVIFLFSLSSFTFIKRLFSSSLLSAIGWYHLHT